MTLVPHAIIPTLTILTTYTGKRGPEVRKLKTTSLLEIPEFYSEVYGAVTTLLWLDEIELLIGTSLGFLVIWSENAEVRRYCGQYIPAHTELPLEILAVSTYSHVGECRNH